MYYRIEEAPMRRQDRRTLNALNRRRSDRYRVLLRKSRDWEPGFEW